MQVYGLAQVVGPVYPVPVASVPATVSTGGASGRRHSPLTAALSPLRLRRARRRRRRADRRRARYRRACRRRARRRAARRPGAVPTPNRGRDRSALDVHPGHVPVLRRGCVHDPEHADVKVLRVGRARRRHIIHYLHERVRAVRRPEAHGIPGELGK